MLAQAFAEVTVYQTQCILAHTQMNAGRATSLVKHAFLTQATLVLIATQDITKWKIAVLSVIQNAIVAQVRLNLTVSIVQPANTERYHQEFAESIAQQQEQYTITALEHAYYVTKTAKHASI